MAKGFRNGPGGIALNFKVVGGLIQPSNPSENTIWAYTDVKITDYKLGKYEPKNPIDGLLWIPLGASSNVAFHALNMCGREFDEVYPLPAKQYVSGAWVDKTVKIYQNGEWVDLRIYLFKDGNEYEEITGGWLRDPPDQYWTGGSINAAGNMYMTGYRQMFCTGNKINRNNSKTLCV